MTRLVLVAAGGLAREVSEAARACGVEVKGALDDDSATWGTEISPGVPVLGGSRLAEELTGSQFVLCAGNGTVRRTLQRRLGELGIRHDRYATIVHPGVRVPNTCVIGRGSILLAGTVLTADVSVGRHVVCMPSVVLTHDCRLDDFSTLCAGAVLGGGVQVREAAYLGMSCAVRERVIVGSESVVGMGAVVIQDVEAHDVVVGAPARSRGMGGS